MNQIPQLSRGARLVKSTEGDKYIEKDSQKHHIPDPETKNALGLHRMKFVTLTDEQLARLGDGEEIESVRLPSTRLVRTERHHDDVFIVFTWPWLHRWHVPDIATLTAMGRRQSQVDVIGDREIEAIPEIADLCPVSKWDPNIARQLREEGSGTINNYGTVVTNVASSFGKVVGGQKNVNTAPKNKTHKIVLKWVVGVITALLIAYLTARFGLNR